MAGLAFAVPAFAEPGRSFGPCYRRQNPAATSFDRSTGRCEWDADRLCGGRTRNRARRSAAGPGWRGGGGANKFLSEASRYDVFSVVANGPAFGTRLTPDQESDRRADAPRYEKRCKGLLLNLLTGIPSSIGGLLVDLFPYIRRLPAYLSGGIL